MTRWQAIRLALVPVAMAAVIVPLIYAGVFVAYPELGVVAIMALLILAALAIS